AHVNGSLHRTAELRRKDRELAMQEEVNKRLALSDCVNTNAKANASVKQRKSTSRPLIERARKAASEVFPGGVDQPEIKSAIGNLVASCGGDSGSNGSSIEIEGMHKGLVREMQPIDYRERQERELKFTAAGWKRDSHGRWFKDENVEFDSDEEDPNIVLNNTS
ncbi:UNVERIFIED_CONTAM: Sodium channel modifier 1, partial [Sesamum angustifolium]